MFLEEGETTTLYAVHCKRDQGAKSTIEVGPLHTLLANDGVVP